MLYNGNFWNEPLLRDRLVLCPAYTHESYEPVNPMQKEESITKEKILEYCAKTVKYKWSKWIEMGVLGPKLQLYTQSGYRGMDPQSIDWFGEITLNPRKKKHQEAFNSYSDLMEKINSYPVVSNIETEGNTARLTITAFSVKHPLNEPSGAGILRWLYDFNYSSPLRKRLRSAALKYSEVQRNSKYSTMEKNAYETIQGAFILDKKCERINHGQYLDESEYDFNKICSIIEKQDYPQWLLTITVSDPAWIEHLAQPEEMKRYYGYDGNDMPWNEKPLKLEDVEVID